MKLHTAWSKLSRLMMLDFDAEVKLAKALKSGSVVHLTKFLVQPTIISLGVPPLHNQHDGLYHVLMCHLFIVEKVFFFFRRFT